MAETREERRAAARAEQQKVAPGTGIVAWLDRTTWTFGGGRRAGDWHWKYPLFGFVTFAVASLAIGADPAGAAGGLIGLTLLMLRGYSVHRRYVEQHGTGG